jgi:hypothetical protein
VRDPLSRRVSVSYASSEIIVEIILITEKCSPGFVLITQVRRAAPVQESSQPSARDHRQMSFQ